MSQNMNSQEIPLPLEGIRIIEMSHMVMGPSCGLVLADLGAEVIKIEPPGTPEQPGDPTRYLVNSGAGFFPACNRNKKSVLTSSQKKAVRPHATWPRQLMYFLRISGLTRSIAVAWTMPHSKN